jgi:hypothetical protein
MRVSDHRENLPFMTDEDIVTHLAAMERRLLAAVTAQTAPKGDLILKPPGSLLSTGEAAVFLRISPESLRRLCRRKAITFNSSHAERVPIPSGGFG